MPRDDLSIDFVGRMPQTEPLDPGIILDDWINRVQNLPEEIKFIQEEILDKDRQYNECIRVIEDRDGKIQKWIKTNGSHEPNPKEELLRAQIRENFTKADRFSQEKIALTQKLQLALEKHMRSLDNQIKLLYDRAEPGFTDPDEVPSLLRSSAANHSAPSIRSINPSSNMVSAGPSSWSSSAAVNSSNPALARLPSHPLMRTTAAQQQNQQQQHAASAPTTPAASLLLNRQREGSTGPGPKRGQRSNSGVANVPATSSGLARHSSLGPGTQKSFAGTGNGSAVRAGSAGPKATTARAASGSVSRRGTPGAHARKKPPPKSTLSRVKKVPNRNSPASTAESDLSAAESGSGEEEDAGDGPSRATPPGDGKDAAGGRVPGEPEDDDEDAGDDRKYCICHNVSYGDMVACDNDNCPYEWFHWSCVGLKSEPNGTWYCPVCTENLKKKSK